MITKKVLKRLIPVACVLLLTVFCVGCETAKGLGRDIKNADQWMRDHAW
jgi:predicted small secreted protein